MKRLALTLAFLLLAGSSVVRGDILRLKVDGVIHPISAEYIARGIEAARQQKDKAVLIELRTPGGLETSTREIVQSVIASPVPVIIWVGPSGSRAASAGFFILQSADVAVMAPGTNTGAAHPVALGGNEPDEVMMKKIENDSAALMRSITSKRGRNVAVAESAVRESKSFTDGEALQQHLIDLVASSPQQIFERLATTPIHRFDGKSVTVDLRKEPLRDFPLTLRQQILGQLMDPNVAFLLFALGAMALWAEFTHPGAIVPGVVGALAIVLAVFALNLLPTRFAALGLIIVALILFALEAKFTSHGVLGIGGVIAMTIGALMLVDGPIPELRVRLWIALAVSIPFGLIAVFLMTLAVGSYKLKHSTGSEAMVGLVGVARTSLAPEGKVFVRGELWNAIADSTVEPGGHVQVRAVDGLMLHVTATAAEASI